MSNFKNYIKEFDKNNNDFVLKMKFSSDLEMLEFTAKLSVLG